MSTLPATIFIERTELAEIMTAGARTLKQPGKELQRVKREYLTALDDAEAALVIDACNMLLAACLAYEAAKIREHKATDAVALVTARMDAGLAEATVFALLSGPTRRLVWLANDHAPLAFYSLTTASPDLDILNRLIKSPH